jgi:GcrA cell cycle regulator
MKPHSHWNRDELALLGSRWPAPDAVVADISAALPGRSMRSVSNQASELKLVFRSEAYPAGTSEPALTFWTEERTEQLRLCVADGLSFNKAARLIGCTKNAAISKARRSGIVQPPGCGAFNKAKACAANGGAWLGRKRPGQVQPPRPKLALVPKVVDPAYVPGEVRAPAFVPKLQLYVALEGSDPQPVDQRPRNGCMWPIGEGSSTCSCSLPKSRGSYCESHAAIAYRPPVATKADPHAWRRLRRYL